MKKLDHELNLMGFDTIILLCEFNSLASITFCQCNDHTRWTENAEYNFLDPCPSDFLWNINKYWILELQEWKFLAYNSNGPVPLNNLACDELWTVNKEFHVKTI